MKVSKRKQEDTKVYSGTLDGDQVTIEAKVQLCELAARHYFVAVAEECGHDLDPKDWVIYRNWLEGRRRKK